MSDDLVPSVKGIVRAYDTGIKLAKRVTKSATSDTATATAARALEIAESAHRLQSSLERSSETIRDVYDTYVSIHGDSFAQAVTENSKAPLSTS